MPKFTLPLLPYEYNALEPFIDEKTMKIHHTKHHQAYIDKLNAAIAKYKILQKKTAEKLLVNNRLPQDVKFAIRNNAGGYINHSFFWPLLKKNTQPKKEISKAINKSFGNFEKFKAEFTEAALKLFGSGWTWLVYNPKTKELEITSTPNQENPIAKSKIPILTIDLWEHAYYLKYQNKRPEYVENFFKIINWEQVEKNYLGAVKNNGTSPHFEQKIEFYRR